MAVSAGRAGGAVEHLPGLLPRKLLSSRDHQCGAPVEFCQRSAYRIVFLVQRTKYVAMHKIRDRMCYLGGDAVVSTTRTLPGFFGAVAVGASALVLLSSWAGGVFAPADSLNIAATVWWLPMLAALGLMAIVRRRRATVLILLAGCLALGAILFAPLLTFPADRARAPTIRLVTYNMFRANAQAAEAVDWIVRQDADFVIVLEAAPFHHLALERLRRAYPFAYSCAGRGYCSTMLFSRQAAQDVWPLARGDADNRRALSALTARFDLGDGVLPITAVHLNRPWPLGDQATQLPELADAVATLGRRGVMAGDFNSSPWTFAMRRTSAIAELKLASGGGGTWPATMPALLRLPLDQVYVGSCITATAVRRGPALGSDHLPLVVDIAVGGCLA